MIDIYYSGEMYTHRKNLKKAQNRIKELEQRVKELEEALTFYAEIPSVGVYIKDSGMKARDTLLNR